MCRVQQEKLHQFQAIIIFLFDLHFFSVPVYFPLFPHELGWVLFLDLVCWKHMNDHLTSVMSIQCLVKICICLY